MPLVLPECVQSTKRESSMVFPALQGKRVTHLNLDRYAQNWFLYHNHAHLPRHESPFLDPVFCGHHIERWHKQQRVAYSYGGYLEDRSTVWRGSYLDESGNYMHLGIDLNVPAGTEVAVDCSAHVVVVDNDHPERHGWGGRVMVALDEEDIVLIYAHLEPSSICCKVGETLKPGEVFGATGTHMRNGQWYPHLHVQALTLQSFLDHHADKFTQLDGYGHPRDVRTLSRDCPDPIAYIRP